MKDFFISYNKTDKEWAKWIAGTLEEYGYETVIQEWDFEPGNNFILKMQEAILNSKKTILVLSHSYLNSKYCKAEWSAVFNCNPTGEEGKLIPIRIDDVDPNGLLSNIVYIDFNGLKENMAVEKLLNGIGYNKKSRKKPTFPSSENAELLKKAVNQDDIIELAFDLKVDNSVEDISISTKNRLRKWYFGEESGKFKVIVNDMRQIKLHEILKKIELKIRAQQDLTKEEEFKYGILVATLKNCVYESKLKEKAVEFFLKDKNLQALFSWNSYLEVLEFIKDIFNYDYFDQKRYNDSQKVKLDIFLTSKSKEFDDHFVVCIERKKIDEIFGGHSVYDLWGAYVIDLSQEVRREVAVVFYIFLAEQVINSNNGQAIEDEKVLNLLKYKVGIH